MIKKTIFNLTSNQIDSLSNDELMSYIPSSIKAMSYVDIAEDSLLLSVEQYGLDNLPADFLRVFCKHFLAEIPF